jgi:hypothetical protein
VDNSVAEATSRFARICFRQAFNGICSSSRQHLRSCSCWSLTVPRFGLLSVVVAELAVACLAMADGEMITCVSPPISSTV